MENRKLLLFRISHSHNLFWLLVKWEFDSGRVKDKWVWDTKKQFRKKWKSQYNRIRQMISELFYLICFEICNPNKFIFFNDFICLSPLFIYYIIVHIFIYYIIVHIFIYYIIVHIFIYYIIVHIFIYYIIVHIFIYYIIVHIFIYYIIVHIFIYYIIVHILYNSTYIYILYNSTYII